MSRKKGVISSYVLMAFEILSTLFITPYIIRTLGQAEFGVYKLSASISSYLLLLDLGVGNAVVRYIAKFRNSNECNQEEKFFGITIIYYALVASVSFLVGVGLISAFPRFFAKGLTGEEIVLGQKLLWITVFNIVVTLGTNCYNSIIIAYERFTVSKGISILQIAARMTFTVLALKIGMRSTAIVTIELIMTAVGRAAAAAYVFFRLRLRPKFRNIELGFAKEVIVYSSWILLQMVATQINAGIDQILLGAFVSASSAIIAVYSVGAQVVSYFQSIGHSFTGVLMPGVVKLVEKGCSPQRLCGEMIRIGRIVFMALGLIWCGFVAFGRQFINLWVGIENAEAYYVAAILMTAYLFIVTEAIGTQILWAKNEHKEQAILKFCIVLLNTALTILLIRWNPLIGATIGTFVSLVLGDLVVMNFVFRSKIKISLKQYYGGLFEGLLPVLLISVGLGVLINFLPLQSWAGLIAKIGLMTLAYIVMLFLFGMNGYEKTLLASLFKIKDRTRR